MENIDFPLRFTVAESDADEARKRIVASGIEKFEELSDERHGKTVVTFLFACRDHVELGQLMLALPMDLSLLRGVVRSRRDS